MSTELPNQPDEPANRPPAREFQPPPLPRQAEAVDWAPPPVGQPAGCRAAVRSGLDRRLGAATMDRRSGYPGRLVADAPDTRAFWRRIPAGWLIAGALVLLVGAFAGGYFNWSRSATGEREVALPSRLRSSAGFRTIPSGASTCASGTVSTSTIRPPTRSRTSSRSRARPSTSSRSSTSGRCARADTRPTAAAEQRNHGREVIDIEGAFWTYLDHNCIPAFRTYIGRSWYGGSDLDTYWLVPTDDAWRAGDRTVHCASFNPVIYRLTESLRGTRQ